MIAVGTSDGHMIVVTEDTGTHVTTVRYKVQDVSLFMSYDLIENAYRMCGTAINGIKFNLDGDLIAGASQNGSIYIYKVSR